MGLRWKRSDAEPIPRVSQMKAQRSGFHLERRSDENKPSFESQRKAQRSGFALEAQRCGDVTQFAALAGNGVQSPLERASLATPKRLERRTPGENHVN